MTKSLFLDGINVQLTTSFEVGFFVVYGFTLSIFFL
jgi:hypothetical protein